MAMPDTVNDDLLQSLFEASPDLLCISSSDGRFRLVNPAFTAVLGYTSEELTSQQFLNLVHPDDRDRTSAEIVSLSIETPTERFVNRYRCKDGSYRWLEWRARGIHGTQLVSAVARDVTNRVLTRQLASDIDLTAVQSDSVFDGIARLDAEGRIVHSTPVLARMLTLMTQELEGKRLLDFVDPQDQDDFRGFLAKADPGNALSSATFLFVPAIGSRRRLEIRRIVIPSHSGELLIIARDVTEQFLAEAKQQQSEDRMRLSLEAAGGGTWAWDPVRNVTVWDGYPHPIFPDRSGTFQGSYEDFISRVHPEDRDMVNARVREALDGRREYDLEFRTLAPDGSERIIADRGRVVRDEHGRLLQMTGVCWDITERVTTSRELAEAHRRLSLHLENSPLAHVEWDRDFRVVRWSRRAEEIFGYKADEVRGKSWRELNIVHQDDLASVAKTVEELLSGRVSSNISHNRNYRNDGKAIWCEWYNSVLTDDDGNMVSILSFTHDITRRIEMEQAYESQRENLARLVDERASELREANRQVEENEQLLRSVLLTIPDFVARIDRDGRFVQIFSDRVVCLSGTVEDLPGTAVRDLIPIDDVDEFDLAFATCLSNNQAVDFEYVDHRDNGQHPCRVQLIPFEIDGGQREVLWISADLTERREAEKNIRQLTRDLQHAARLSTMGEMAGGIAHELHQPLMAITNFANGTRLRLESGHFEVSDLIQVSRKINDEALRAGEITRRIKQFLRKHDPQFGPVDIDQVISDAVELARISPNARGIRIPVERPEQPIRVWGDATQLTQVVVNLLLNAMDALSHQTGSWRTASVVVRRLAKTVEIAVMDNGPGIDPENLGRVFDQFFTTKPEGLGLGLAISRSIVQSHGGMISVQSSRYDGTTFTVSLPIDTASHGGATVEQTE